MRSNIIRLLAQQGQAPVILAINKSIDDLKRAKYTHGEIKEIVREWFYGLDGKVDEYIINKGY